MCVRSSVGRRRERMSRVAVVVMGECGEVATVGRMD